MDGASARDSPEDGEVGEVSSNQSSSPAVIAPFVAPAPEDGPIVNNILARLLTDPYGSLQRPMSDAELDEKLEPIRKQFGDIKLDKQPEKREYGLWVDENKFWFLRETLRQFPNCTDVAIEICENHMAHIKKLIDVLAMLYIYPFYKNFEENNALNALMKDAPIPPDTTPKDNTDVPSSSSKRSAEEVLESQASKKSKSSNTLQRHLRSAVHARDDRDALDYHKRCCLIWKASGGAEVFRETGEDDDIESNDELEVERWRPEPSYEWDLTSKQAVDAWLLAVKSATDDSVLAKDPMELLHHSTAPPTAGAVGAIVASVNENPTGAGEAVAALVNERLPGGTQLQPQKQQKNENLI
ncbi:hypothetical protein HDU96_010991 [Phlyctochytrium bullatum]|nr:hypothetical protein HDU96_010991 [Phlyctochytrium bullatum]